MIACNTISRRTAITAIASLPVAACVSQHALRRSPLKRGGTILAPAPPATPLHHLNLQLGQALVESGLDGWNTEAIALPRSVNQTAGLPRTQRAAMLPIVTTADFELARTGSGPPWHAYDRANRDLLFVSSLYDVGFGLQVVDEGIREPADLAGRTVAAPARPSAVRMMSEALIEEGWALEGVRFLDCAPAEAATLLARGDVAASAWNLVLPKGAGFAPMLPTPPGGKFLPVERQALEKMNRKIGFSLATHKSASTGPIVSFAQALAAWADTPDETVATILRAIARHGNRFAGLPDNMGGMRDWPGLVDDAIHPAARDFYMRAQTS